MLPTNLNTNEVKSSAGAEIEFLRWSNNARELVFAKSGETPSLPHRLLIAHQESGSGLKLIRRSVVRVDKTFISQVDTVTPTVTSAYMVLVSPVGHMDDLVEPTHAVANLLSFCASLGASTTILYDGTGNGAASAINGSL